MTHALSTTSRRRGFTMMEIMVTVAVIAILVAMIVGIGRVVKDRAMVGATKATLSALQGPMSRYIHDNPEPSANPADWLVKLTADPREGPNITNQKGYVAGNPPQMVDAWGNPIYYIPSRTAANSTVPLAPLTTFGFPKDQGYFYSTGPDGQPGGNDDLFSDGVAP